MLVVDPGPVSVEDGLRDPGTEPASEENKLSKAHYSLK